ncbi:MAG: carbohydrate ABC transporter permease [Clostridiales bacterium]|jgi:multiple sugar transport system permease protein|nr:carbohydrate ABC transporter permease [Clostridiales bacterium]
MGKRRVKKVLFQIIMILLSIPMIFPLLWMIRSSFMTDRQILSVPIQWLPTAFSLSSFESIFRRFEFGRYFFNTFMIVALNVIGAVLSASFCAFGFARLRFRGRSVWFALLLSTIMIPSAVLMIPQFIGWSAINAYDTYWPLILPAFFGNAMNIFLVRQFYMGIPKAYDEAALVDGAGYFQIYLRVIMPMSVPALCTVGVLTFVYHWNDFIGPLIYISSGQKRTLSLGLQMFIGEHTSQWNQMMAAAAVITLPMIILYAFAQKYFIEGITLTGVKG